MANNYYLGQTPEEFFTQTPRYFYGLTRTDDGFLKVTKINLDSSTDSVNLENLTTFSLGSKTEAELEARIFDQFEEGVDFFEGVDGTTRMPNYDGLNFEQYKWSPDDLYYYVDSDGQLCVRIDTPYNYAFGQTTYIPPEVLLSGSTASASGAILAGGYDLGSIRSTGNPTENIVVGDLGSVSDQEGTFFALTMGTITGS